MTTTTTIILSKTETNLLVGAAGQGGVLVLPAALNATTAKRLLSKLVHEKLIVPSEQDGETQHRLTPAGYRAVNLRPKRAPASGAPPAAVEPKEPSKKDLVTAMLLAEGGASLAELIAMTGWLPHTTRAALSRLRSAGEPLVRFARPDAVTAYRLAPPAPTEPSRRKRAAKVEVEAAAA